MDKSQLLDLLKEEPERWKTWRAEHPDHDIDLVRVDLSGADLRGVDLSRAHLFMADLSRADLRGATLWMADLRGANLTEAHLSRANLYSCNLSMADLRSVDLSRAYLSLADLTVADLRKAQLSKADLSRANLSEADLSEADLSEVKLLRTNLSDATLTGCRVYGVSAWDIEGAPKDQSSLVITPEDSAMPMITVDDLSVAQFIYLLPYNPNIRDAIDTITSKVVLILGRFTAERLTVLNAVRTQLRERDYLPVLFDFKGPSSRDLLETVSTLAHMARFIIADITDAKSIPAELERIVPDLPSVPVQPLILESDYDYALFRHMQRYPWVLEPYRYQTIEQLLATLDSHVISPVEERATQIRERLKATDK